MRKVVLRSFVALLILLTGLSLYGTFRPNSALSAFAPCTVASVACFYKVVDSAGVNVAAVNSGGNQASNVTQFGGTAVATGTGAGGAGIPRVTVSSDSSLAANQSTNVAQFGGTNVATGTGAGGTGIPRVTVSNDSSLAANQSVNLNQVGGTAIVADPCEAIVKTYKPISITANTQIITGTSAKQTYICSINLGPLISATNVALVEGSGTTCATTTLGMAGGNTAATGWGIAAGGGLVMGDGIGAVAATATLANNVCLFVSAANQVSGVIAWVQK